jgi:hypothetical protein
MRAFSLLGALADPVAAPLAQPDGKQESRHGYGDDALAHGAPQAAVGDYP